MYRLAQKKGVSQIWEEPLFDQRENQKVATKRRPGADCRVLITLQVDFLKPPMGLVSQLSPEQLSPKKNHDLGQSAKKPSRNTTNPTDSSHRSSCCQVFSTIA